MSWFSDLRAIGRITREAKAIRLALVRIADALDRAYPAEMAVPDAPASKPEILLPWDYGVAEQVEARFARAAGRPPTTDELIEEVEHELDHRRRVG